MSKVSRMLSAAAIAAVFAAGPAFAGQCGAQPCQSGYYGPLAGFSGLAPEPVKTPGVDVYRGRNFQPRHGTPWTVQGVTVYAGGGGLYVNGMKAPDYVEALEVVAVTRGAGLRERTADAICVSRDGHTMPAARVRRATHVAQGAAVELFRCETGFTLQAVAARAGRPSKGDAIVCVGGASLWSAHDGGVQCKTKRPLDWSEAELRHAFGTGPVVLSGGARSDHAAVTVTRGISLTGGVGYAPY